MLGLDATVLFEGKYPQFTEADCKRMLDEVTSTAMPYSAIVSPEERCRKLFENTVRVLMPERVEGKKYFIQLAKDIAASYGIDTTITEYDDRLVAAFTVDCYNQYAFFRKILFISDEIHFDNKGENVIFSLAYYTHATYRSGRRITPDERM